MPSVLPQARSSLGWVTVNGERLAVEIDVEWMRALSILANNSMANISYSNLMSPTSLGAAASVLFSVPSVSAGALFVQGKLRLANTTGGAVTVTLYAVPSGGSPSAGNAFLSGYSIAANSYADVLVPIIPAGGSVQGLASSGAAITASLLDGGLTL